MNKRIFAVIITAVLFLTVFLPVSAGSAPRHAAPEGYDDNDYQRLVAFLETKDPDGRKNGDKLCAVLGKEYDPEDPESWQGERFVEEAGWSEPFGIMWTQGEPMRVFSICIGDCGLCGELDVSGCDCLDEISCAFNGLTAIRTDGCTGLWRLECSMNSLTKLDLSDSPELVELICGYNALSSLDVTHNTELMNLTCASNSIKKLDLSRNENLCVIECTNNKLSKLDFSRNPLLSLIYCDQNELTELNVSKNASLSVLVCSDNRLTKLDVSGNTGLSSLNCSNNQLTELNVSGNAGLETLSCAGNRIKELDLSDNPRLAFDRISAEGGGFVGYDCRIESSGNGFGPIRKYAVAAPEAGCGFIGWYTEDGELITTENELPESGTEARRLTARFEGTPSPSVPTTGGASAAGMGFLAVTAGAIMLLIIRKRKAQSS